MFWLIGIFGFVVLVVVLMVVHGKAVEFGDARGWERCETTLKARHEQALIDQSKMSHDAGYRKGWQMATAELERLTDANNDLTAIVADLRRRLARPKPTGVKRPHKNELPAAPSPRKRTRKTTAFTLIELLIVLAIVSLLAAMCLPVFARVRAGARRSTCQSNLHQLTLATRIYTQDYDGYYPVALIDTAGKSWQDRLEPYLKDKQVLLCPDGVGSVPTAGHYGANFAVFHSSPLTNDAIIQQPCSTLMLVDAGTYEVEARFYNTPGQMVSTRYLPGVGAWLLVYPSLPSAFQHDYTSGRHFGGVDVAFCDGHVKWMAVESVYKAASEVGGMWGV